MKKQDIKFLNSDNVQGLRICDTLPWKYETESKMKRGH